MATKNNKRQKKKNGASVQELLGIKAFTEYGIQTNRGELLFFKVRPTNISVLSQPSVETKIQQLRANCGCRSFRCDPAAQERRNVLHDGRRKDRSLLSCRTERGADE